MATPRLIFILSDGSRRQLYSAGKPPAFGR